MSQCIPLDIGFIWRRDSSLWDWFRNDRSPNNTYVSLRQYFLVNTYKSRRTQRGPSTRRISGYTYFHICRTMRDGADHFLSVEYRTCAVTCPVRAVEISIPVGKHAGWDMSKGYSFPSITKIKSRRTTSSNGRANYGATSDKIVEGIHERRRADGDFSLHSFHSS